MARNCLQFAIVKYIKFVRIIPKVLQTKKIKTNSPNLSDTARSEKNQSAYMLKLHLFVRLHFTIGARGTKNYPLLQKIGYCKILILKRDRK